MKNIFDILKEFEIEVPEDKHKDFEKAVLENYKTLKDYNNQADKLEKKNDTIKANDTSIEELEKKLEEFKDVDVSGLKQQIDDLKKDKESIESEYQNKIADRDFQDILKEAISDAKGKNVKAITALLNVDELKASKNQKEDIAAAIKTLTEAEDSSMLFGDAQASGIGTGNTIGNVGGKQMTAEQKLEADCWAAMGLPPEKGDK